MIRIMANEVEVKALIDTGAQLSVISGKIVQKMLLTSKKVIRELPANNVIIKGVCGARRRIKQQILVDLEINGKQLSWQFLVVNDLLNELIIGIDALTEFQAEIDVTYNWINFRSINEKLSFEHESTIFKIENITNDAEIKTLINDYAEIFENKIGKMKEVKVKIKMLDERPFKGISYPIQDVYMDRARETIKQLEKEGIIKKQATDYINPLVVQEKKDGNIRICLDARNINKRMEEDTHQPLTIEDLVGRIDDAKVFSTIDIRWAFLNMMLDEESQKYTGFLFDGETYVHLRLPFGLKISSGRFAREFKLRINKINSKNILIYIDEIMVFKRRKKKIQKRRKLVIW